MDQNFKTNAFAYFQLIRLPNLFTAMADVLAGYLIVCGSAVYASFLANSSGLAALLSLLCSTSLIYAGGCALNDVFDRHIDAVERPFRPIPSGRIPLGNAIAVVAILYSAGLFAATLAGWRSFAVAVALVVLSSLYDGITKHMALLGPLNMAACRAVNLILGMTLNLSVPWTTIGLAGISLIYVFSLTVLSKSEVQGASLRKGLVPAFGWGAVVLVILGLIFFGRMHISALFFLLLLVAVTAPALYKALRRGTPVAIGNGVKFLVLGIPLLDAVYVSGVQHWIWAIPVALCLVPSVVIARYVYVT